MTCFLTVYNSLLYIYVIKLDQLICLPFYTSNVSKKSETHKRINIKHSMDLTLLNLKPITS